MISKFEMDHLSQSLVLKDGETDLHRLNDRAHKEEASVGQAHPHTPQGQPGGLQGPPSPASSSAWPLPLVTASSARGNFKNEFRIRVFFKAYFSFPGLSQHNTKAFVPQEAAKASYRGCPCGLQSLLGGSLNSLEENKSE